MRGLTSMAWDEKICTLELPLRIAVKWLGFSGLVKKSAQLSVVLTKGTEMLCCLKSSRTKKCRRGGGERRLSLGDPLGARCLTRPMVGGAVPGTSEADTVTPATVNLRSACG